MKCMRQILGGHGSESAVGTEEGACLALRRKRAGNQRSGARGRSAPCTHTLRMRSPFLTLELSSPSASHRCLLLSQVGSDTISAGRPSLTISFQSASIPCLLDPP